MVKKDDKDLSTVKSFKKETYFTLEFESKKLIPYRTSNKRRSRFQKKIRAEVRRRTKAFMTIKSIEDKRKNQLLPYIRHSVAHLAADSYVFNKTFNIWLLIVSCVSLVVASLITVPVTTYAVEREYIKYILSLDEFIPTLFEQFLLTFFGVVVVMGLLGLLAFFRGRGSAASNRLFSPIAIFLTATIVLGGMYVLFRKSGQEPLGVHELSIFKILAGGVIFCLVIIPSFFLFTPRNFERRFSKMSFLNSFVINELLIVLLMLEKQPRQWNNMGYKKKLIAHVEEIAAIIERRMPSASTSEDGPANKWVKTIAEEIATGFRELIKWIITPKLDTREKLIAYISDCLVLASQGDWDRFPRSTPEKIPTPEAMRQKAIKLLRTLFIAFLPVSILTVISRVGNNMSPTIYTYISVGSYIWAILTLLSSLDPEYNVKLNTVKSLSELITGTARSKDK